MLAVQDIHLAYGASQALRGVSLEATKGAVTCVLGRNGVGKTTLLRAILGLEPIQRGRVLWEDQSIEGWPTRERARGA